MRQECVEQKYTKYLMQCRKRLSCCSRLTSNARN